MPACQNTLADAYHTTTKPDKQLLFHGSHRVVGLDIDPKPMPQGRFIYYVLDNPVNDGLVLRGTNVCSWSVTDPVEVRSCAIALATRLLGSAARARKEVDQVIAAGGMLLPS